MDKYWNRSGLVGFLIIAGCAIPISESKPSLDLDSLDQPIRIYGRARHSYDHLLRQKAGPPEELAQLKKLIGIDQAITGSPLVAGNQVRLLIDGPMAFESIFEALRNARHHIHVETFILQDDQIGQQFADIIRDRLMAGVEVRILYDAVGVLGNEPEYFKRLREYGVQLHKYNPIDPTENPAIWRINIRHHRKILVVDGRLVFLRTRAVASGLPRGIFLRTPGFLKYSNPLPGGEWMSVCCCPD